MVIRSKDDLKGYTLRGDDEVVFVVDGQEYEYEVFNAARFLSYMDGPNDTIFNVLGLDANTFTTKTYGYENSGGAWPTCKSGDLPALTRCVVGLYEEIEKRQKPATPKVGDKVRIITDGRSNGHQFRIGQEGKITRVGAPFFIVECAGQTQPLDSADFEVVSDTQASTPKPFKPEVGKYYTLRRRSEINDADEKYGSWITPTSEKFFDGRSLVKIVRGKDSDGDYRARFPDGNEWDVHPDWLMSEAASAEAKPAPDSLTTLPNISSLDGEDIERILNENGYDAVILEGKAQAVVVLTEGFIERLADLKLRFILCGEEIRESWANGGFPGTCLNTQSGCCGMTTLPSTRAATIDLNEVEGVVAKMKTIREALEEASKVSTDTVEVIKL
jgi:hypothetical protein